MYATTQHFAIRCLLKFLLHAVVTMVTTVLSTVVTMVTAPW